MWEDSKWNKKITTLLSVKENVTQFRLYVPHFLLLLECCDA